MRAEETDLESFSPGADNVNDVKAPHHRVYVVRLRNPRRGDRREAFYVGMTGLPIEQRFANHKRGYKAASVVTKIRARAGA